MMINIPVAKAFNTPEIINDEPNDPNNAEYSQYLVGGISNGSYSLPILANNQHCLSWKYSDMCISKIAIRISPNTAFPIEDQIIHIGTPLQPKRFGYFETRTQEGVYKKGEWIPLTYENNLKKRQYDYYWW